MDKTCVSCKHFRQGSVGPTKPEHVWGDCLKARAHAWGTGDAENSGRGTRRRLMASILVRDPWNRSLFQVPVSGSCTRRNRRRWAEPCGC